jgi:hypothetical protein
MYLLPVSLRNAKEFAPAVVANAKSKTVHAIETDDPARPRIDDLRPSQFVTRGYGLGPVICTLSQRTKED